MPKFLIQGSYSPEGLKALVKDKASGRKAAVTQGLESVGGKLEAIYYALGEDDVYVLCDCPDHVTAAALSFAASSSGLVRTKTTMLMTVEEADRAISMGVSYQAPGTREAAKA